MARGLPSMASLARLCQKLNRLKPLEDSTMETSLRRCLSTLDLTLLGVGGMVGSGLYVLTGAVAKDVAGPAVLLSFGVAAVASLLAALCYAEFGARVPRTGSAYLFTYVSMGELWAFLIGWNVLLEYIIGGAAVARAWSGYLDSMFSHSVRNFTETHVGSWQVPLLGHYPDFLAAGIILLASAFVSCGARVSSWLNHTFSAISLLVILFIVILGFILAQPHNWSTEEGGFAPFGFSGVMAGTASCFYLLLDLESLVQFLSLGTLLAYTFVATSIIVLRFQKSSPPSSPGPASPGPLTKQHSSFSDHLQLVGTTHASLPEPGELQPALKPYLGFLDGYSPGAVVTWALGVMLASAITIACVLVFGNSTLHLPHWGYILLLLLTSVVFLLSLLVLGAHQQQYREDLFQIPMVPLIPALSILLNICLMLKLSYLTWVRFSIWLLMGLAVYFGYGIRHSKENQRELPGPNSTHYVVFPRGSLEETVQAVQPPSQAPAQDPGHME
ncbi:PREDICTED: cationic amino acid transporter 4 [Colobus angolensis palliatus]|uniref:cationic amino acid transporter 4 n=1 Tax=Colobus angolensis palliatus TaxID=336983 RepID=UPI0005F37E4B|nr:PREDICTED: cationic amino acid transporter 4 [Colobus angolensis palliatus]